MVVAFQCNCSYRYTRERRQAVARINVRCQYRGGRWGWGGVKCDQCCAQWAFNYSSWRTVILMSDISNLLLVTWEQCVSYKLLLLVTSSCLNNWLWERESLCETGINRMAECMGTLLQDTYFTFFECQKIVEWAQISFMLGPGWSCTT